MAKITKHGEKNIKRRAKVKSKNQSELVDKVLTHGLSENDCKGNLRRFISKQRIKYPNSYARVYNNFIYFFSRDTHVLITCYPLPGNLTKIYHKINKKSK